MEERGDEKKKGEKRVRPKAGNLRNPLKDRGNGWKPKLSVLPHSM